MAPAIRWIRIFWCFYILHVLFFLYPPCYDSCNAKIKVCNEFKINFHCERLSFWAKKPIYSFWPFYTPAQSSTAPCALLLVLIQLRSPRCWHLDSNYCRRRCRQSQPRFVLSPLLLHPRLLGTFQPDIPLFTLTWTTKHSPNQGWESTYRLHLYPLGGVFYSPLA